MEAAPLNFDGFYRVLAIIGISLGGLISLLNWWTVIESRRRKKHISAIPLLGFLPLGLGLYYFDATRPYAWICFVADYFIVQLAVDVGEVLKELWRTSRFKLQRSIRGEMEGTKYELRLYQGGKFVLKGDAGSPRLEGKRVHRLLGFSTVGQWGEREGRIVLSWEGSERGVELMPSDDGFVSGPFFSSDAESKTILWKI
jgi:hypothetical protein